MRLLVLKINLKMKSEYDSISRALFDVYTDVKKKELTKNLKFDTLIEVDCFCNKKTEYILNTLKE